jgi:hypothetical protein
LHAGSDTIRIRTLGLPREGDPAVYTEARTGVPLAAHPGDPVPAKKDLPDHIRVQKHFPEKQLQPRLDEAVAGRQHVFFVDAAHFRVRGFCVACGC